MISLYTKIWKKPEFTIEITDPRQKVVFHSLRHTLASRLAEAGVDLYTIKTLLGHSTIALTERYSHLSDGALQGAMRTLDEANKKPRKNERVVNLSDSK